ncbi:MAG: hypothetical protein H0X46_05615 [Bacteroidetes bacterium]|nr:hypothetical protein [Bacteroidota bacterium]
MKTKRGQLKKGFFVLFIIAAIILTGYLRDSVFKTINALLRAWDLDQDYPLPAYMSFLNTYEYDTIVRIKWLLTFAVSILYFSITLITIKILFNQKKYLKITVFTYAGILLFSALFIGIGFMFSSLSEKMYGFARYLMGMAQSPIILMILIPAFKISEKENKKTTIL